MECLNTIKSLKINLKKNVGTVLIVVEGSGDEFKLFKHVFVDVLHYKYIEKTRLSSKYKNYEFQSNKNINSKIIVVNAKNSNISTLDNDIDYLNNLYIDLYNEYKIDVKNVNTYFVWDRDYSSNKKDVVENLIKKLSNSLDNTDGDMNGLLLLSYPALESYIISCYDKDVKILKYDDLKKYIKNNKYVVKYIDKNMLVKSVVSMHNVFIKLGIFDYNLDDFGKTSLKVFQKQEEVYLIKKYYYTLSLISIIFMDLGIITSRN